MTVSSVRTFSPSSVVLLVTRKPSPRELNRWERRLTYKLMKRHMNILTRKNSTRPRSLALYIILGSPKQSPAAQALHPPIDWNIALRFKRSGEERDPGLPTGHLGSPKQSSATQALHHPINWTIPSQCQKREEGRDPGLPTRHGAPKLLTSVKFLYTFLHTVMFSGFL